MRFRFVRIAGLAPALVACAAIVSPLCAQQPPAVPSQKLAPYVSSPQPIVDKMLEIARLKSGEIVYDLGCGDGRILFAAAQNFGAKGVGVELSDVLVKRTRERVDLLGLQDQVRIVQGDMLQVNVSEANVVALYLLTEANDQLRPKLERELKPGSRVVSLEFKIPGWKPSRVEKIEAHRHPYTIYLYELPRK